MKARFKIEKPHEVQCTLEITMVLSDWEELEKQLNTNYPSWELSQAISTILTQAKEVYYAGYIDA